MLSEVGEQPRTLRASLKLASLPQGVTLRTLIWGSLNLQVRGQVCLQSPPSKARLCFSKGTRPAGPPSPGAGRLAETGCWGGRVTMLPPPIAGL